MQSLRAELAWSPRAPRVARAVVRAWLEAVECADDVMADLVLVASELVTRAVNGCPAPPTLECSWSPHWAQLVVGSAPMLDEPSGDLGSAVIDAISDDWGRVDHGGMTSLWALLRT